MCRNGHTTERELIYGRLRCPDCYKEAVARRNIRRRTTTPQTDRIPYTHRCPYCHLFPCRCEEL